MTDPDNPKAALRRVLRERRASISADEAKRAAAQIAQHLEPWLHSRQTVAVFSATDNEVDLSALYERLLDDGVALCFPRVEGPGAMVFAAVDSLDDLRAGAYGIAEPGGPPLPIERIDVFLVPGLGFDRHGARLGFGGGYYDRALSRRREAGEKVPLFVGIGYSCQVIEDELPTDDWDIRLDAVVTESGVIQV